MALFSSIPRPVDPDAAKAQLKRQRARFNTRRLSRLVAGGICTPLGILIYCVMLYLSVCAVSSAHAGIERARYAMLENWADEHSITIESKEVESWATHIFSTTIYRGLQSFVNAYDRQFGSYWSHTTLYEIFYDLDMDEWPVGIASIPKLEEIRLNGSTDQHLARLLDADTMILQQITIDNTDLSAASYDRIAALPNLKSLTIVKSALPANAFASPAWKEHSPKRLSLISVPLNAANLQGVEQLDLTDLDLTNCQLTDDTIGWLSSQAKLRALSLNEPGLTDDALRHLTGATSIHTLYFGATPISGSGLKYLSQLHQLRRIDLTSFGGYFRHATIEHQPDIPYQPGAFSAPAFPTLSFAKLNTIPLDDDALKQIATSTQLENLTIRATHVTDQGLPSLSGLAELTGLTIHDLHVDGPGFKVLNHLTLANLTLADSTLPPDLFTAIAATRPHIEVKPLSARSNTPISGIFSTERSEPEPAQPAQPSTFYHLRKLTVSDSILSKPALTAIATIAIRYELSLQDTGITDDTLAAYSPILWPDHLDLTGNPVTPDGIAALIDRYRAATSANDLIVRCKTLSREEKDALATRTKYLFKTY